MLKEKRNKKNEWLCYLTHERSYCAIRRLTRKKLIRAFFWEEELSNYSCLLILSDAKEITVIVFPRLQTPTHSLSLYLFLINFHKCTHTCACTSTPTNSNTHTRTRRLAQSLLCKQSQKWSICFVLHQNPIKHCFPFHSHPSYNQMLPESKHLPSNQKQHTLLFHTFFYHLFYRWRQRNLR